MHRRIDDRLRQAGVAEDARERILESNAAALLHRLVVLGDEEHFELLHPSRTLLILMDDCGVADAEVLRAAASVESEHVALRIAPASALANDVPAPDTTETLLEDLVVADLEVRLIALAERLDHARHLHLRDPAEWPAFHESMCAIYAPVAPRTHPRLAYRYDWWCDMFGRRFLGPAAPI